MRFAQEISNITDALQRYWIEIPGDCPELRTRAVPDTETVQLLNATRTTFQEAENDINRLREDLQQLLHSPSQHSRQRRYAHLLAAAAGAGLLTLGAQLATGCVAGVLGPCPNERNIAANRQQIQNAIANIEASNQHWAQVQSETNEQIFVLNKNVDQLAANQKTLQQNQEDLWTATQETLNGLAQGLQNDADLHGVPLHEIPTQSPSQHIKFTTTTGTFVTPSIPRSTMELPSHRTRRHPRFGSRFATYVTRLTHNASPDPRRRTLQVSTLRSTSDTSSNT